MAVTTCDSGRVFEGAEAERGLSRMGWELRPAGAGDPAWGGGSYSREACGLPSGNQGC